MSRNRREREQFIARATENGIRYDDACKLLRFAATLQRLAEAQCNGDWPYNGDRDRPSMTFRSCDHCDATGKTAPRENDLDDCLDCQGTGRLQTNGRERMRWDARYTVCPRCEASGVRVSKMVKGVCPDCRTTERATAFVASLRGPDEVCQCGRDVAHPVKAERIASAAGEPEGTVTWSKAHAFVGKWAAQFQGDPRGCVFRLHLGAMIEDKCKHGCCQHTTIGVPA